jgi:hypothetical protein
MTDETETKPDEKNDRQLKEVEGLLKAMQDVKFEGIKRCGLRNLRVKRFQDWPDFVMSINDPDEMRNALYYGFQPIYDLLIRAGDMDGHRQFALDALNLIVEASVDYLTNYYLGTPDLTTVKTRVFDIDQAIQRLDGEKYQTKFRNVDHNGIYPAGIHSFLVQFFEHVLDGQVFLPDYVIGCACGASEIAMPLAGLLNSDIHFIRRSFRRGDDTPKIVEGQDEAIGVRVKDRRVICIEDYVCTGQSLGKVMGAVKKYDPSGVRGASPNYSAEGNYLQIDVNNTNFHLFSMR